MPAEVVEPLLRVLRTSIRPPPSAVREEPLSIVVALEVAAAVPLERTPPPTTMRPVLIVAPLTELLAVREALPSLVLLEPEMMMDPPSA